MPLTPGKHPLLPSSIRSSGMPAQTKVLPNVLSGEKPSGKRSTLGSSELRNPVHGEFIIMRRWAFGTTLDNASASGRNPKLGVAQIRQHPVLVDLPPSLHACDEH